MRSRVRFVGSLIVIALCAMPMRLALAQEAVEVQETSDDHILVEALIYANEENILPAEFYAQPTPDSFVTRLTFVQTIIHRFYAGEDFENCFRNIASSQPASFTHVFADVPNVSPFAKDLCVGIHAGLLDGKRDGTFQPHQPITIAEASKILAKTYGLVYPSPRFTGKPWYQPYMQAMRQRDAIYYPRATSLLTTGQMAVMFYMLKDQQRYPNLRVVGFEQTPVESDAILADAMPADELPPEEPTPLDAKPRVAWRKEEAEREQPLPSSDPLPEPNNEPASEPKTEPEPEPTPTASDETPMLPVDEQRRGRVSRRTLLEQAKEQERERSLQHQTQLTDDSAL